MNGTPTVASCSIERVTGFSESHAAGILTNCAWVPSRVTPKPAPLPQTAFPTSVSPSTTVPAKPRPGVRGSEGVNTPPTILTSLGLIADAYTSTRTSPSCISVNARLRGGVSAHRARPGDGGNGRGVANGAAAVLLHERQLILHSEKYAAEVDSNDVIEVGCRVILDAVRASRNACVVERHIEPPAFLADPGDERGNCAFVGDIQSCDAGLPSSLHDE